MISQNSWPAIPDYGDPDLISNPTVPGTAVQLLGGVRAGDAATVLLEAARRWNATVEPLKAGDCWGYQPRNIRGSSTVSNHASGTAIDLNAPDHALGTTPAQTMTARQIVAVLAIVAWSGGVIRWGGTYTGRKDPMHLEIDVPPGDRRLADLAERVRAGNTNNETGVLEMDENELRRIIREEASAACNTVLLNTGLFGQKTWTIPVYLKAIAVKVGAKAADKK